jgi:hypothetical protein
MRLTVLIRLYIRSAIVRHVLVRASRNVCSEGCWLEWVSKVSYVCTYLKNTALAYRTVVIQEYSELVIRSLNNLWGGFRRRLFWICRNHPELPFQHQGFRQMKGVYCKLREKCLLKHQILIESWGLCPASLRTRVLCEILQYDGLFVGYVICTHTRCFWNWYFLKWRYLVSFWTRQLFTTFDICSLWIHVDPGRSRHTPLHNRLLNVTVKYENVPRILCH